MNTEENVEHLRQSPHIYDQSLGEHKDAVLLNTWKSDF